MKTKHRALSILLSLVLILTVMPAMAFAVPEYNVTFDANGGYFDDDPDITTKTVSTHEGGWFASNMVPAEPVREGYYFGSWMNGNNTIAGFYSNAIELSGNTTYYAKWMECYKATFYPNGGKFSDGTTQPKVAYADVNGMVVPPAEPENDGKIFAGWASSSSSTEAFNFESWFISADAGFYAIWEDPPAPPVGTFDANGGYFDEPGNPTSKNVATDGNGCGIAPAAPINNNGKAFGGWVDSLEDYEFCYDAGDEFYLEEDRKFYARWINGATVTFDANGDIFEGGEYQKTKVYNTDNEAEMDHYRWFNNDGTMMTVGWAFDTAGNDPVPEDYVVKQSVTVYAVWGHVLTVVLDPNGGAFPDMGAGETESVCLGEGDSLSDYVTKTVKYEGETYPVFKPDHMPESESGAFAGWYLDSGCAQPVEDIQVTSQLIADNAGILRLYADYAPSVSFTIDANGGTVNDEGSTYICKCAEGWAFDLGSVYIDKHDGEFDYEVAGWYSNSECTADAAISLIEGRYYVPVDGAAIYAAWQEKIDENDFDAEFEIPDYYMYSDSTSYTVSVSHESEKYNDLSYDFSLFVASKDNDDLNDDPKTPLDNTDEKYFKVSGNEMELYPEAIAADIPDLNGKYLWLECTITENRINRVLMKVSDRLEIHEPEISYCFDDDWSAGRLEILTNDSLTIEKERSGYVSDGAHPEGEYFEFRTTSVELSNLDDFKIEEDDHEYNIIPLGTAETFVTVHYTGYGNEEPEPLTFMLAAVNEMFEVEIQDVDGTQGFVLPGGTIRLKAVAAFTSVDEGAAVPDYTYEWSVDRPESVSLDADTSTGRVDVTILDTFVPGEDDVITATVNIVDENGTVRASEIYCIYPRSEFYSMTGLPAVDKYMRPGTTVTIAPKLIRYWVDADGRHNEEVSKDKCAFTIEEYDDELLTTTGTQVWNNLYKGSVAVKRLDTWDGHFVVTAYAASENEADDPYYYVCSSDDYEICSVTNINTRDFVISGTKDVTYNKKAFKPSVTVRQNERGYTLKKSEYSTSYGKNTNVGWGTVSVTGKGEYYGTKTAKFRINPKSTSLKTPSKGKNSFTVSWIKQATQTTGYEIQYGLKKNFKGAKTYTVKKNSVTKATIKKLKAKRTYYIRIRTYKMVGKTKFVSAWSKTRSVKTK